MDVGPARQPRSPLVFQVGAEPHFPRMEWFPTGNNLSISAKESAISSYALFPVQDKTIVITFFVHMKKISFWLNIYHCLA